MNVEQVLRILYEAGVEFVVIGGAAMNLQGSAYLTKDLDFCYARTRQNMANLTKALAPYHPRLRGAPENLPFRFDTETISRGMNFTLTTDLGDLDFLGEVTGLGDYDHVILSADKLDVAGIKYDVLSLSGLIEAKRAAGRSRDLYVLPELEALEELKRKMKLE